MPFANLSDFHIQPTYGYLPHPAPLEKLPHTHAIWDQMIEDLPLLIEENILGKAVNVMPRLDDGKLHANELERAKLILGMLAQAYVWEPRFHDREAEPRAMLPEQIADPLMAISKRLDEPPIFNYADYVLRNWKVLDASKPLTIENLTTLATFSDRDDEKMFVVVHVAYEYVAGKTLTLGEQAMLAADNEKLDALAAILETMASILVAMKATFLSVKDVVSPDIFRDYIRLFLKGWKNNTPVAYGTVPAEQTQFRGETGSQSSVIPFFDALLSIFRDDANGYRLRTAAEQATVDEYLDFRNYMPAGHRNFIRFVENTSRIRDIVSIHNNHTRLVEAYNQCVHGVAGMRQGHKSTVNPYIGKPGQLGNLGYGTGGSDYQDYLGTLFSLTEASQLHYAGAIN